MEQDSNIYLPPLRELMTRSSKKIQNGFLMLKAHYRSEQRTITASKLASAAGYDNYGTGNEQYGNFAHEICKLLDFQPEQQRDGSPIWTYAICDASDETNTHGHFQWILKPEVASALEQLKLVSPIPVNDIFKDIADKKIELDSESDKSRDCLIKARVGQGLFRERLINHWEGCSVTGYENTDFLIASHIKPWRDCDFIEAIDVTNGLLLLPNIDRAFDKGFISFNSSGSIMLSPQLSEIDLQNLGLNGDMKLRKCFPQHDNFLAYHRDILFRRSSC